MTKMSAGLLLYRRQSGGLEVLLVHPGGPFWAKKDFGSWSIPKGEYCGQEAPMAAARREFREETGFDPPDSLVPLGEVKQPGGKIVSVWAAEGDCDPTRIESNTCEIEWPRGSGRRMTIPEIDRGSWFSIDEARRRILKGQAPFLDQLSSLLAQSEHPRSRF